MALTDQPYLPLYVDDWMNNNKLKLCSLEARGLMVQIMCVMHKSDEYGKILLKQKFKQNPSTSLNFASQLARLCLATLPEIEKPFFELLEEEVIEIEGDYLICPRMVKDARISEARAAAGKNGGKAAQEKLNSSGKFAKAKPEAKDKQNPVNENESVNVNENESIIKKEGKIDFENIVLNYNEICGDVLPKVQKLTSARKKSIAARAKEYKADDPEAFFAYVFKKVRSSRFLTGQTDRPFRASFDWIVAPTNFLKIIENNYDNAPGKQKVNRQTAETVTSNREGWEFDA